MDDETLPVRDRMQLLPSRVPVTLQALEQELVVTDDASELKQLGDKTALFQDAL